MELFGGRSREKIKNILQIEQILNRSCKSIRLKTALICGRWSDWAEVSIIFEKVPAISEKILISKIVNIY